MAEIKVELPPPGCPFVPSDLSTTCAILDVADQSFCLDAVCDWNQESSEHHVEEVISLVGHPNGQHDNHQYFGELGGQHKMESCSTGACPFFGFSSQGTAGLEEQLNLKEIQIPKLPSCIVANLQHPVFDTVKEGLYEPASISTAEPPQGTVPIWFEREKFEAGKMFYKKYFSGLFLSNLLSLYFSFMNSDFVFPMVFTGQSSTKQAAYKRYLRTALYTKLWYDSDIWNPECRAYHSIRQVRKMHQRVANDIKKTKPNFLYFSQTSITLTQWLFMSLILLFPEKLGARDSTRKEQEGLIYFWKCIGYLMGAEDKYNLCTGTYEEVKTRCTAIYEKFLFPQLKKPAKEFYELSDALFSGVSMYMNFITRNSMLRFLYEVIGAECNLKLTLWEWFCWKLMSLFYKHIVYWPGMRERMNNSLAMCLDKARKKNKEMYYLVEKKMQ